MPDTHEIISFVPGVLGEKAARVRVLYFERGLLALEKPALVAAQPHPLWPDAPNLRDALRAVQGRDALRKYALKNPSGVFHPEPEISGIALFASDEKNIEYWRNAFGSRQMKFSFELLAKATDIEEKFLCDLPITQHSEQLKMLVTHTQGKRTQTIFERVERLGAFDRWQATTDYPRPHQIRLHAHECALDIVGEILYGQTPEPLLSSLKPRYKNRADEKPIYGELCAHLGKIELPDGQIIEAPPPKKFALLMQKIRQFSS